jgi:hypothetical protein
MKLNNGDRITIKGNCVVNNSTRTLYVESVRYSTYSVHGTQEAPVVEKIVPYTVYRGRINYAFENPPHIISEKKKESNSTTVKIWLHY